MLEKLSFEEELARVEFLVFPILPPRARINQRALAMFVKELLPQLEDVIRQSNDTDFVLDVGGPLNIRPILLRIDALEPIHNQRREFLI